MWDERSLAAERAELALSNETYLQAHPEFQAAMNLLMVRLLNEKPSDAKAFVRDFFCDPDLQADVSAYLERDDEDSFLGAKKYDHTKKAS